MSKKNERSDYHEFVIKDGVFIGEFEEMYQIFDDPWHQKDIFMEFYSKMILPITLKFYNITSCIEMGCGLGAYTKWLSDNTKCKILGVDISWTAIQKARSAYPELEFDVGDVLGFTQKKSKFQAIIFSEIMWYILDDLDKVIDNLKLNYKGKFLIINQVFYKEGKQKYGCDFLRTKRN